MPQIPRHKPSPPACLNALRTTLAETQAQHRMGALTHSGMHADIPSNISAGAHFPSTDMDKALGQHGLSLSSVHEVLPQTPLDHTAAMGFMLALLKVLTTSPHHPRPAAPVMHIAPRHATQECGRPYGPGLRGMGLNTDHWVFAQLHKPTDVLNAAEEALRSHAVAAVIAHTTEPDFTATRRLSLAAQATGTPIVLLCSHRQSGATAAQTRWRIAPEPSAPHIEVPQSPGAPRWRATLTRARGGHPNSWLVEYDHETHALRLVDPLARRSVVPHPWKNHTNPNAAGNTQHPPKRAAKRAAKRAS